MTFIRFDIDYDKITLDDQIINRPPYLSASQWLSFWSYSSSEEMQAKIDQAYKDGSEENEKEHLKELEYQKDTILTELRALNKAVNRIFDNTDLNNEERLTKIKDEIGKIEEDTWLW